jgi:hypothetical protein
LAALASFVFSAHSLYCPLDAAAHGVKFANGQVVVVVDHGPAPGCATFVAVDVTDYAGQATGLTVTGITPQFRSSWWTRMGAMDAIDLAVHLISGCLGTAGELGRAALRGELKEFPAVAYAVHLTWDK